MSLLLRNHQPVGGDGLALEDFSESVAFDNFAMTISESDYAGCDVFCVVVKFSRPAERGKIGRLKQARLHRLIVER